MISLFKQMTHEFVLQPNHKSGKESLTDCSACRLQAMEKHLFILSRRRPNPRGEPGLQKLSGAHIQTSVYNETLSHNDAHIVSCHMSCPTVALLQNLHSEAMAHLHDGSQGDTGRINGRISAGSTDCGCTAREKKED